MAKTLKPRRGSRKRGNDALFKRADQYSDAVKLRAAFRLFLAAAKNGDQSSQLNVGYCYDTGKGVRQNTPAALYWYKRAYRRGDSAAAANVGTVWRDKRKPERALYWFRRAIELGDEGAYLEIAKLYLHSWYEPGKAIRYLERVCRSQTESEATIEDAQRLLKFTRAKIQQLRTKPTIAS